MARSGTTSSSGSSRSLRLESVPAQTLTALGRSLAAEREVVRRRTVVEKPCRPARSRHRIQLLPHLEIGRQWMATGNTGRAPHERGRSPSCFSCRTTEFAACCAVEKSRTPPTCVESCSILAQDRPRPPISCATGASSQATRRWMMFFERCSAQPRNGWFGGPPRRSPLAPVPAAQGPQRAATRHRNGTATARLNRARPRPRWGRQRRAEPSHPAGPRARAARPHWPWSPWASRSQALQRKAPELRRRWFAAAPALPA